MLDHLEPVSHRFAHRASSHGYGAALIAEVEKTLAGERVLVVETSGGADWQFLQPLLLLK